MKIKNLYMIKTTLIFLSALFLNNIYGQDIRQISSVELDKGCKIVLDSSININDSLSIIIINRIKDIVPEIQSRIPTDSITIYFKISNDIVPVWGVGGNATGDHSIDFSYDPEHENFRVEYIICGLIHEFMHVSRFRMPDWELTLLECMITEGLADHFSNEVLGCSKPPWTKALSKEQIQESLINSEPILYIKHENWDNEFNNNYFNPWMFGRVGEDPIPAWAGYSIGWELVENYIKNHSDTKASDLVWIPAKKIADSTLDLKPDNQ